MKVPGPGGPRITGSSVCNVDTAKVCVTGQRQEDMMVSFVTQTRLALFSLYILNFKIIHINLDFIC